MIDVPGQMPDLYIFFTKRFVYLPEIKTENREKTDLYHLACIFATTTVGIFCMLCANTSLSPFVDFSCE